MKDEDGLQPLILEVDYVAHWKETDYVAGGR